MGALPERVDLQPAGDGWTRVEMVWQLKYPVLQDDLSVIFDIDFVPTFWWAPHLTPEPGSCIAQHAFRSPALIAADDKQAVAVVPDVSLVASSPEAPWYMDVDAPAKRWWLGISKYTVRGHVGFEKANGARFPAGEVKFAFFVNAYPLNGAASDPFEKVSRFHWEHSGRALFAAGETAQVPMDRYVRHTYTWAFDTWRQPVWQEFTFNGRPAGAPAFIVNVSQSPNAKREPNQFEFLSVWNQAWFSSLRSASGLFRFAKRADDKDLMNRALLSKEFALAAPMQDGILPSVYRTEMETVNGRNVSKGWDTAYWTNSNRTPGIYGVEDSWYHVLDASWTAYQMLRWYRELEPDTRLLEYAQTYADKLLTLQYDTGFFPAWLDPKTLEPSAVLRRSPETSMSAWFLFELAEVTGKKRYARAATDAINAVLKECVAQGRWEDFETYWSCNRFGEESLYGKPDPRSGMFKQCNFGMFWTAEALLAAHRATHKDKYLQWGRRVLHELSLTQQTWQPPFIKVPGLGGFGVMNYDGEWNDARQSLFAEVFMDYYRETGEREYFERGIAALKASFVMMYCPENAASKAEWEKAWPFFGPADYGFMMENYGHGGKTGPGDNPMGEFTIYDWGNGAASEARSRIFDHYGDVYIDRARNNAFGIDSVDVQPSGGGWTLSDRAGVERDVLVVFSDGQRQVVHLTGQAQVQ